MSLALILLSFLSAISIVSATKNTECKHGKPLNEEEICEITLQLDCFGGGFVIEQVEPGSQCSQHGIHPAGIHHLKFSYFEFLFWKNLFKKERQKVKNTKEIIFSDAL